MKILTRYIIKEFIKILTLTLAGFISLYLIIDIFEQIDNLIEHHASFKDGLIFFLYKIPFIFYQVSPVALLMATLIAIGILGRHSEVIAAMASGVSVLRLFLPFFVLAAIIGIINFIFSESIIPYTNQQATVIRQTMEGINKKTIFAQDSIWFKDNADIYNISYIEPQNGVLKGLTVYRLDNNFNIISRIDAKLAHWSKGAWISPESNVSRFQDGRLFDISIIRNAIMPLTEKPEDLKNIERLADEMNFRELRRYIKKLKQEGYAAARYSVDLHSKISFPIVSIIMVILGIPFALRSGRHGGIAVGVGISVMIGFSYWVVFAINTSLGYSGIIPPLIAAWLTNFIFAGVGVLIFSYIRQ